MRQIYLFIVLVLLAVSFAQADELNKAYQKEYAYLVAEKEALEKRLIGLEASQQKTLSSLDQEIASLQKAFLEKQNQVDRINKSIADASRDVDFSANDLLLLETTLIQAKESLNKLNIEIDETAKTDRQLEQAFKAVRSIIQSDGQVTKQAQTYFDVNGKETQGSVLTVGRIAKFGIEPGVEGALSPSGEGKFKIWDAQSTVSAKALAEGANPEQLSVFLYDNADVAIEKKAEKGFEDDIKAGGLIGKIILAIGLVGLALVILRVIFLMMFGADIQKITNRVNNLVKTDGVEAALKSCKSSASSASRVIAATLRNLKKERDHIEDIISEAILFEASKIDRFGSAILVIAAVSPLLGLLGTVTGMIGTFDIITEFGTGDPKLLSTGISEALVTTKFGLIVAIPLLLVGNMLSNWAMRTKNGLERAALNVINTHKESQI